VSNQRRFFIDGAKIAGDRVKINGDLVTQIRCVLRLKNGDWVQLLDGRGTEYDAQIVSCSNGSIQARIVGKRECKTEPKLKLTVAISLPKADKVETVVQKCTELGMSKLIVFMSERSVPRPDEARIANRMDRWRRIAVEAAEQSGRALVPQIEGILDFGELISKIPQYGLPLLAWEGSDSLPLREIIKNYPTVDSSIVIIGPEGGFTECEAGLAKEAGAIPISLGKRILRCETAAVAVTAVLMNEYGDTT
jgi:16S rRNA (uracil1498-N3)-methyltransferase